MIHVGDCLDVLRTLDANSVDSVVCDPPYALPGGFMGKAWDNHDGREDAGFGYWLAGFTDGEGCFRVQRHERGTHTCAFQIKLRRDDRGTLERIRRFVGHGTIRDAEGEGNANPQAVYVVQDQSGCEAVVGLFRRFPLTAKKALDFEVWADSVGEWCNRPRGNRWHGAADQAHAAALKARLEDVRRYVGVPWSGHRFQDWCRLWGAECLRVLKPGGFLLAFGAPRQYHRLAAGLEDAGFEVRDCMGWLFGSGFPKSHNLGGEWQGWGTALKPAWEPIVMARKPLIGTVAANVLAHGTGVLNIDGCRVPGAKPDTTRGAGGQNGRYGPIEGQGRIEDDGRGRWPANLIHDGSDEVLAAFPQAVGQQGRARTDGEPQGNAVLGALRHVTTQPEPRGDAGSAARFFYCAKASRADRNEGLGSGPLPAVGTGATMRDCETADWSTRNGNHHPTVKPTDLMRYLCRLVTPPGGLVLDPFAGSGSTGKGAILEGFRFLGIEREPEYAAIAQARIDHAHAQRLEDEAERAAATAQADLFGVSA